MPAYALVITPVGAKEPTDVLEFQSEYVAEEFARRFVDGDEHRYNWTVLRLGNAQAREAWIPEEDEAGYVEFVEAGA